MSETRESSKSRFDSPGRLPEPSPLRLPLTGADSPLG
jgi:hypothetical protein